MKKEFMQTLQCGLGLAYEYTIINENDHLQDVLLSMIELVRFYSDNEEQLIFLSQEIKHINTFLSLQELRFPNEFCYRMEVDERLNSQFIRKHSLLEPIMHFFYHKIEIQVDKKDIEIKIYLEGNEVNIQLWDGYTNNIVL